MTSAAPTAPRPVADDDPVLDPARLEEVARFDLFAHEVQERMDEFARRAAERFGLPVGLVTVVLDSAVVFAGAHGLDGWVARTRGHPVEWAFCVQAVRSRATHLVPDARAHPEHRGSPLVTLEGITSYAGAPLVTSRGHVLGALCVVGAGTREFAAEEVAELEGMAREVARGLEADASPPPRR